MSYQPSPATEAALEQLDAYLTGPRDQATGTTARERTVRGLAAIERAAPGSVYVELARRDIGKRDEVASYGVFQAAKALRDDLAAGRLRPIDQILHAQVFEDFLDMATELLENGFASPAAVLAGSVLEEHVRKLAAASDVQLTKSNGKPRSFDDLAIDLTKQPPAAILETERKSIAAWYGLRTAGAHGRHAEVVDSDVERMIPGIRDFMVRHPA
jgi:hypothetical protein